MTDDAQTSDAERETPSSASDDASSEQDEMSQLSDDLGELYQRFREEGSIQDIYDKNPYAVLASAAGVGYALGGGLLTPFSKRIARFGMKALVVPFALSELKELTQAATQPELEESGDSSEIGNPRPSEHDL